jgi:xanthine dehydrogenase YagT iron-sulfur-binding subunit
MEDETGNVCDETDERRGQGKDPRTSRDGEDSSASSSLTRRHFLTRTTTAGSSLTAWALLACDAASRPRPADGGNAQYSGLSAEEPIEVSLRINGVSRALAVEPRVTLLDSLREKLGITGPKKGCDHGQCGACTVLVNGRRVLSCLSLTVMQEGKDVITVEGIARGDELHPVQTAFIENDAFQCGYCTPGQICSAVGMLREVAEGAASYVTPNVAMLPSPGRLSDAEIRERMSGNLCRCSAYPNIVAAIREASRR